MTLTIAHARRIAGIFPGQTQIAVLDGREAVPTWTALYPQSWSAEGVVLCSRESPVLDAPVVAVVSAGTIPEPTRNELAKLRPEQPHCTVTAEPDGVLSHHGRPLAEPEAVHRAPIHLTLMGRRTLVLPNLPALPVMIQATLPSNPAYRLVHVTGSQFEGALPGAAWLRVIETVPAGPVDLELTIVPARDGGRWALRYRGQEVSRVMARPPEPAPVRQVYIVFDRTCPDANRWLAARQLVRGLGRTAERARSDLGSEYTRSETPRTTPIEVPQQLAQEAFNQAIRQGLIEGLHDSLDERVEVHFVWFADVHGNGLGCPTGVSLPQEACGWAESAAPSRETTFAVSKATYVPGLDLWDALDDALAEVVAAVRRYGSGAVLIVGNSPPRPPEDPHHPFTRLWRSDLPRSTLRTRGRVDQSLADLDASGCPILTVFLTDHQASDEYRTRQKRIRDAFDLVAALVAVPATTEGVARGVRQACQRFREWVSSVDLRRGDEL